MGHYTVVYLVTKHLSWSEAEGDLAVEWVSKQQHAQNTIYTHLL